MGGNSFVYILHKEFAWHPATMTHIDGKKAKVTVPQYPDEQSIASDGGRGAKKSEEQTVDLKYYTAGVLPLQNVDSNGDLIEFPDMVELPYLHEVSFVDRFDSSCCRISAFFRGVNSLEVPVEGRVCPILFCLRRTAFLKDNLATAVF